MEVNLCVSWMPSITDANTGKLHNRPVGVRSSIAMGLYRYFLKEVEGIFFQVADLAELVGGRFDPLLQVFRPFRVLEITLVVPFASLS
jgi:hypothetical protein